MASEVLIPAEARTFGSCGDYKGTVVDVTIDGAGSSGQFDLTALLHGTRTYAVTNSTPTVVKGQWWGTEFSITNTGTTNLLVETNV